MKKIVDGVLMDMTSEEVEAHLAATPPTLDTPLTPTKEELLAQLNVIAAQIQALA